VYDEPTACGREPNGLVFEQDRKSNRSTAMQEIISIRDANRHLSRYLKKVEEGAEIIITRCGKPIARVLPVESRPHLSDTQRAARERLWERMNRGYSLGVDRVDREILHERGL
jgi:prevent-host-death family protein